MDGSDYVTSLLMGASVPGLDFGALDGGFLDMLCGGGGGGEPFAPPPPGGADSREGSSVSDPAWARARDGGNARKRKAPAAVGAGEEGKGACLGKVRRATSYESGGFRRGRGLSCLVLGALALL
jgi:hypothetical protein